MSSLMSRSYCKSLLCLSSLSIASLLVTGCGATLANTTQATANVTGPAFLIGTDAPMPSVTSFSVQINSINATTTTGTSVPLLSGTPTVDFARFNGLQTLLDMNDVPAGSYTGVTITLGRRRSAI